MKAVCKYCGQSLTVAETVNHIYSAHPEIVAANIARGRENQKIMRRLRLKVGLPLSSLWLVFFVYTLFVLRISFFPGYPLVMIAAPFALNFATAAYANWKTRFLAPRTRVPPR